MGKKKNYQRKQIAYWGFVVVFLASFYFLGNAYFAGKVKPLVESQSIEITATPTPTADPNPLVNCVCGKESYQLKSSVCDGAVCCQLGNDLVLTLSLSRCIEGQTLYNNLQNLNNTNATSQVINRIRIPTVTIPTLKPYPTLKPQPTMGPAKPAPVDPIVSGPYSTIQTTPTPCIVYLVPGQALVNTCD